MTHAIDQARASFQLGLDASTEGRWADAEAAFGQALALVPGRPSLLANLALARLRLARPAEALPLLDELVHREPEQAGNWALRAEALVALGRHDEALPCHDRVLQLQPDHRVALFERACSLQALGRVAEALQAHTELLQRDPAHAAAWHQRGGLLKDMGRLPEAAECFRQALAHGGDEALNRFFLASVEGQAAPQAAPRPYVEALFDSYAEEFDQHLTGALNYRTPALLAEALPSGWEFDAALDLGCGTGLMAPLLVPRCRAIDGIDLSSQMLAKAQQRGQYRRLVHGDVVEFLQQCDERYDLVVAADVFVYIGDLTAVFAGVARVLQPGGLFLMSVEQADAGHDLQLRASSRYAHSAGALQRLAAAHGMTQRVLHAAALREDQGRPVAGWVLLLQAAATA